MGFFDSPEAPTPPNPMATAAAQTGTNVSTAIANSYLGNVNQNTPQGNLAFNVGSNFDYTDPTTGQSFSIPRWTATQTLNPTAQQTFNQTQQAQGNLAGMANQQSGALQNLLGSPFNPNTGSPGTSGTWNAQAYLNANPDVAAYARNAGIDPLAFAQQHYQDYGQGEGRAGTFGGTAATAAAPGMGDINLFNQVQGPQSSIGATDPFARDYASGGAITRDYGPQDNFSADRQRVEESMFQRVNPQIQQQEGRLRQQLADQGIRYGSEAYAGAYDPFNRGVTDTRLGIVAAGGQEQQRMNEMARNRAMFQNTAQQQAEGQNAARAAFGNQALQSQFEQALNRGTFFNQAQNQMLGLQSAKFNAANQLRNQNLQEQYQLRNQPINEITALLSGSQVAAPSFINAQRNTIPTTDVAGLINQNFAQSNDLYKTGMQTWGDIIGGTLGAAGNIGKGYMMSDVRAKENIAPMGSILSPKGELPIYQYDYKPEFSDGQRHVGPMAQDVERLDPSAVKTIGGMKHIKRDKLGSIFGSA